MYSGVLNDEVISHLISLEGPVLLILEFCLNVSGVRGRNRLGPGD